MTQTLRVHPDQDPFERARDALHRSTDAGRLPERWRLGRTVIDRLKSKGEVWSPVHPRTLYGLPWEEARPAPHDLLELVEF